MFEPSLHCLLNIEDTYKLVDRPKPWDKFEENFIRQRMKEGNIVLSDDFELPCNYVIKGDEEFSTALKVAFDISQDKFTETKQPTQVWFAGTHKLMKKVIEEKIVKYITVCCSSLLNPENKLEKFAIPPEYKVYKGEEPIPVKFLTIFTLSK